MAVYKHSCAAVKCCAPVLNLFENSILKCNFTNVSEVYWYVNEDWRVTENTLRHSLGEDIALLYSALSRTKSALPEKYTDLSTNVK